MKNVRKWDLDSFRNGCVRDYQLAPCGQIISRINHPMETLLHIIDGLDEFTRNVSIQDTFVSVADTKIFHKIKLPRTEDRQIISSAGVLTKELGSLFQKANNKRKQTESVLAFNGEARRVINSILSY